MGTGQVFEVDNRNQLFIDNRFFAQQYGIKLVVNPPVKAEMVLLPEKPWEEKVLGFYSTVIEDEGIYKLWYDGYAGRDVSEELPQSLCYATSKDGIHWQRENVNLFDWMGHEENNIVMPGACGSVMIDPKAPKEERYKALCMMLQNSTWPEAKDVHWDLTGGGIYLLTSPDGIHWKRVSQPASPIFHDSQNFMLWDDRTQKYIAYLRTHDGLPPSAARTLGSIVLEDPMQTPWPFRPMPAHIKANQYGLYKGSNFGNYDIAVACDKSDPPDTDVQICPIVKYPWAEDVFLGLMTLYHHFPETVPSKFLNDGIQDVQLIVSRDGINWDRPDRSPYIPLGPRDSWDCSCIWPSLGIIRSGNEIWQYYCATSSTHAEYAKIFHRGGLCRLVQRLDGFVSADTDYTGGEFTTPQLKFSGTKLELNVDCSALGNVWVEILDEGHRPIDGYGLEEAVAIDRNHIAVPVCWTSGKDVGALQGRLIQLHFKMRACKLYAFQFVD